MYFDLIEFALISRLAWERKLKEADGFYIFPIPHSLCLQNAIKLFELCSKKFFFFRLFVIIPHYLVLCVLWMPFLPIATYVCEEYTFWPILSTIKIPWKGVSDFLLTFVCGGKKIDTVYVQRFTFNEFT